MDPFKTREFKALKEKFYKKLTKEGFRDIENDRGELIDHQTAYDFSQRIAFKKDLIIEIEGYYSWAGEMFWYGKFRCRLDKSIWLMHSQGQSSSVIGSAVKRDASRVSRKIQLIRKYLLSQGSKNE